MSEPAPEGSRRYGRPIYQEADALERRAYFIISLSNLAIAAGRASTTGLTPVATPAPARQPDCGCPAFDNGHNFGTAA